MHVFKIFNSAKKIVSPLQQACRAFLAQAGPPCGGHCDKNALGCFFFTHLSKHSLSRLLPFPPVRPPHQHNPWLHLRLICEARACTSICRRGLIGENTCTWEVVILLMASWRLPLQSPGSSGAQLWYPLIPIFPNTLCSLRWSPCAHAQGL